MSRWCGCLSPSIRCPQCWWCMMQVWAWDSGGWVRPSLRQITVSRTPASPGLELSVLLWPLRGPRHHQPPCPWPRLTSVWRSWPLGDRGVPAAPWELRYRRCMAWSATEPRTPMTRWADNDIGVKVILILGHSALKSIHIFIWMFPFFYPTSWLPAVKVVHFPTLKDNNAII